MIISFNFYYAKPGLADGVLRQRLRACDVRERLDVPRGRVLARTSGGDDLPDVIWAQPFADVQGHLADMAVRAASPEFESIRAGMRKLYRRFERPLYEICGAPTSKVDAPAQSCRLVTLDWIFCSAGTAAQLIGLLQQRAASDDTSAAGSTRLLRLITPGDDLPALVWQREYPDPGHSEAATASILGEIGGTGKSAVAVLAQRVEHSVWSVA